MKPKLLNFLFPFLGKILPVQLAKHQQGVKSLRAEAKVSGYRLHEAGTLAAARCPLENEAAALVAYDRGDPAALDELVKQGCVLGTLQEVGRLWHEMSLRDAGFPGKRESLANSAAAAGREADIANALDPAEAIDFSESADGWFKISPYGTFRGKTPGRFQHVTQESASAMEAEFNSLLGRLGRKFRGVPIYHGHPDVDPEVWPDDRRIGKVTKLESRADGLWGWAEWNSLGEDNKREGWWIYPSPRWDAPADQTRFAPDRLISIGLTNTPRIAESEPVFNSATPDNNEKQNDTIMDPKLIRQKLGLPPEATDEDVMAKIDSLTTAATENATAATELSTAKTEKTEMENSLRTKDAEIARLREEQNNSLLGEALASGRITAAQRPAWEAKLRSDKREEEINALRAIAPARKSTALDLGGRRQERASTDNLREEVSNAVAKLQKDAGHSYHEAWALVKKRPEFKEYFNRSEG